MEHQPTKSNGAEILANNQYNYDGNGNRTQKQTLNGITDYVYSQVGQLTQVDYPTYSEELFYDKRGNRTKRIKNGAEELYSYDPRNRLTELTKNGQTTAFDYDNAGNLLKDDKASYSYDGFNRTTKIETFDGNIQINRYDAEGLRYEMEENNHLVKFIFNQNREVIAEKETTWTSYIRGSTLLASSAEHARTYYHFASDEMSSITHIVDDEKILNEYEYDAWGEVVKSTETVSNRFKFNGQQLDPITQQYYLRARFYNPVIARFTQEDTYRGDGLNLYAYCRNNPTYYVDPTGNICDSAADRIRETHKDIDPNTLSGEDLKQYKREVKELATYDRIQTVINDRMVKENLSREQSISILQQEANQRSADYNSDSATRAKGKGYDGLGTTPNGGADFSGTSYVYPGSKAVSITLTGSRSADFKLANAKLGLSDKPAGYTWHHMDDFDVTTGESTLILVTTDAHNATKPHSGSCAQYIEFFNIQKYNS